MSDLALRPEVGLESEDAFGVRGARWSATGLELPYGLSFENYGHVGYALGRIRDMSAWALGDWVNYGDHAYGEKYAQALELTGRSKAGLMNLASVARRVDRSKRRAELSWSHHEAVASRNPAEQDHWLDRAVAEGLSVEELRGLLRPQQSLTTPVGPDLRLCESAVEDAALALRSSMVECGYGVDVVVMIEVAAGPVAFRTAAGPA